jgi:hypothetical protein
MKSGAPSDLAESLFGGDPAHRLALLKAAWPAAVGPDLARRSEVVALDREVLRVRVPDGIWRRSLWRMRSDLLGRLRQVAGRAAPRGLGFVEGPVRAGEDPPAEAVPPPALETLPPVIAEAAGSIADPELRERFETAASRYLGRFGGTDAQDEDESTSG